MFTTKYKPQNLKEFVGQKEAVAVIQNWLKKWKKGKALLFHGPPGVGKTVLVEAYCNENKIDLIEMNASDYRSAAQIKEVLGKSTQQQSLFKRGKFFMIDEIDGLAGREDRGGVGEIIKIIKESEYPIILTANNPWNPKLRSLRTHCQLVGFKKIHVFDIEKRLKGISDKENVKAEKEVLRELAKKSSGDLRSAINDLEIISQGKKKLELNDVELLGPRERETNIFEVLNFIFKTQTAIAAKLAINQSDKDPEEIFWWIENNIVNEYEKPEEIAKAYDALSKADLFRNWISSRQNWTFRSYMIDLMTAGVSVAKKEMYRKFTRYQYPSNLIVLGRSKENRRYVLEILEKLAANFHCSTKKVRSEFIPFIRIALKDRKFKKNFMESFELTKEDMKELLSQ